jgi:oxygen-independent coproporphyrinogen-3 oxidase
MGSIYIHIPFCQSRCAYCDFFSTTQHHLHQAYVEAVCAELVDRKNELTTPLIETIYLGGGTPSVLSPTLLKQIFDTIGQHYNLTQLAECTLECNPDDITPAFLAGLKQTPINRISMGTQSFDDAELKLMNRRHSAQQAIQAVHQIVEAGYSNCSIDLIYGLPNQTLQTWQKNIDTALSLPIKHLSAYHLTYEKGTRMYGYLNQAVSEETSVLFFETLLDAVAAKGMEFYEISNMAYPGFHSQHNSRYWQQKPYLGIGAGAHSYNGFNIRSWNIADLTQYMKGITQNSRIFEQETLSDDDRYNELIMTSLRTKKGIDLNQIEAKYLPHFTRKAQKYLQNKVMVCANNRCFLTPKSWFISDGIICDLMV